MTEEQDEKDKVAPDNESIAETFQRRASETVRLNVEATNKMQRENPNFEVPY